MSIDWFYWESAGAAGVLFAGSFWVFKRFFKKEQEIPIIPDYLGTLNSLPHQETNEVIQRMECLSDRLDEDTRKLKVIQSWFEDFEDLAEWMRIQGMWDSEDVDTERPMNTYRKGLERYLKEHNIKIYDK